MSVFSERLKHLEKQPATDAQMAAITQFYGGVPPTDLTQLAANEMLSVKTFVQAVAHLHFSNGDVCPSTQNVREAAMLVLQDRQLVDFIQKWQFRRWRQNPDSNLPRSLRATAERDRVISIIASVCSYAPPPCPRPEIDQSAAPPNNVPMWPFYLTLGVFFVVTMLTIQYLFAFLE